MTTKIVAISADTPAEIEQALAVVSTFLSMSHQNGHGGAQIEVLEDTPIKQIAGPGAEAVTEVAPQMAQIRQRIDEKHPANSGDMKRFANELKAEWNADVMNRMWKEINQDGRDALGYILSFMPDVCTYEDMRNKFGGISLTNNFGQVFISLGQWCNRNKKKTFIYRIPNQFYYIPQPFADMLAGVIMYYESRQHELAPAKAGSHL